MKHRLCRILPGVRIFFVFVILLLASSCAGRKAAEIAEIPDRPSFAPGAVRAESESTGRYNRKIPHGEITASWVKSGIASVDKASEEYCRNAAEAFASRVALLEAELSAENMDNSSEVTQNNQIQKDDGTEKLKYTLNLRGGLSSGAGVIGRLWIAEEYLGGARNNITLKTETYTRSGRLLGVQDLFGKAEQLPVLLSRAARKALADRGGQDDMYIPGTEPVAENFRHFLVTDSGLMLYFEPCHVAAWAEGTVKVPVSLGDLQGALPRNIWKKVSAKSGE